MGKLKFFFLLCLFCTSTWARLCYVAALVAGRSFHLIKGFKAHHKASPASLTKLMTLYLLFEALDKKKVTLDTVWTTSLNASNQPPTHWGLRVGQKVTVRQCIMGISVRSCNDMAVLVAEKVAGSVPHFAHAMNKKAKVLGMKSTLFRNPSGLYSMHQYSTAYDIAILMGKLCTHFPQYASCLGICTFPRGKSMLQNTNKLLNKVSGMCAGKTGFTSLSGWNLATMTIRKDRPLIAVVMGMNTAHTRNQHMMRLIEGFYNCPGRLDRILRAPAVIKKVNVCTTSKKKPSLWKKKWVQCQKKARLVQKRAKKNKVTLCKKGIVDQKEEKKCV